MDKIIAIVGPTASGKSDAAIECAKVLNGEVISCDSMQVYKGMDIGTAKITKEEMQGIPHYLLDNQEIDQDYNVSIFQKRCRDAIQTILEKGKVPILCGGTGLYLKAALYDYTFQEEQVDIQLIKRLESLSNEKLVQELKERDPQALEKIHINNRKRLIRALQMAYSGKTKTEREQAQEHKPLYDIYFVGLDIDREVLYQRINQRVEIMFEKGLVQEVENLFSDPSTWQYNSFQGIGYKEFKKYFLKEWDLDQVKEAIQTHSRQYAKRQMTWFKHQMDVHWFSNKEELLQAIKEKNAS